LTLLPTATELHSGAVRGEVKVVEKIREDYRRGLTYRELAKKYRVSFSNISKILGRGDLSS